MEDRSCRVCTHMQTCYARIMTTRMIQHYKLLAHTFEEAENMGCQGTADDVIDALAAACSAFENDQPR